MTPAVILIIISLLFSFFFSGMEVAFVSSNKVRIDLDAQNHTVIGRILTLFTRHQRQFITTDLETRVERVISRDSTTREKVIERVNNQMSDEIKQTKSDFVIYNNNDDKVIKQILSIIHQLNNIHSKQI